MVLSALALPERTRRILFDSQLKTRLLIVASVFGPILAGLSIWIQQAGSVEALPIFSGFIAIFYGWILLQAYFIATPVSHILSRIETGIAGEGRGKAVMRSVGVAGLFAPIGPLAYGVWAISSWSSSTYQNIPGASGKIIAWTVLVTLVLVFSYLLTLRWSWGTIRGRSPQAAVFVGGTFLVLWGYLLYRAATVLMAYVTQNQPSNPFLDSLLILVSILGAMQAFARQTIGRVDRRWSQILPFMVFAFGSVYAVAQFYFILQFAITRIELSIVVNAIVFTTGLAMMMLMIRRHILSPSSVQTPPSNLLSRNLNQQARTGLVEHLLSYLGWKNKEKGSLHAPELADTADGEEERKP